MSTEEVKKCNLARQRTPVARNAPSRRKKWADEQFKILRISDKDY